MQEVKEVTYISKDDAMKTFSEKHKDDPVLMESLTEVGANPFIDSLTIKVNDEKQYAAVAQYLKDLPPGMNVKNVDYFERKSMIDKASAMAGGIKSGVLWISLILGIVAIFIAFNTIKIAIFNYREEVSVMQLVGASNVFIRGPFLVEGLLIGLLSTIIVAIMSFVICYAFNDSISGYSGISTFNIYAANFWLLLLLQLVSGVLLGTFSSYIAVRKHLNV
jgi:cell division transport system permease protein